MPRGALRDLAIAVLRYDQAVRKVQADVEHEKTTCVPDMDELYEEMVELAREKAFAPAPNRGPSAVCPRVSSLEWENFRLKEALERQTAHILALEFANDELKARIEEIISGG